MGEFLYRIVLLLPAILGVFLVFLFVHNQFGLFFVLNQFGLFFVLFPLRWCHWHIILDYVRNLTWDMVWIHPFWHLQYVRYKLVVAAPEPRKIGSPTITNIQVYIALAFLFHVWSYYALLLSVADSFWVISFNYLEFASCLYLHLNTSWPFLSALFVINL